MNTLARSAAIALTAALLLCGSACTSVSSRAKERPQAFQSLTPENQSLVLSGKIREGMGRDAVYIAWGRPDEKRLGSENNRRLETWNYFGVWQESIPAYEPIHRRDGRRIYNEEIYTPIYVNHSYLVKSVTFEKEKVVAWAAPASR